MGDNRSTFNLKIKNATTERFVPLEDPVKIKGFYIRAESIKAGIVLWTDNKKMVVKGKFKKNQNGEAQCFWGDFHSDQKEIEPFKLLAQDPPDKAFLMIIFPKQVAFALKAKIVKVKNGKILFETIGKVFRAQRRKDLRLTIPAAYSIHCNFISPSIVDPSKEQLKDTKNFRNFKIYDISVGGVSFYVPPEQAKDFPVGKTIKDFSFSIRSTIIKCDVTVRNAIPGEVGKIRIGTSFLKLFKEHEDFLIFYITEHAMQMTSNFY